MGAVGSDAKHLANEGAASQPFTIIGCQPKYVTQTHTHTHTRRHAHTHTYIERVEEKTGRRSQVISAPPTVSL